MSEHMTPQQAQYQIDVMMSDPAKLAILQDRNHRLHEYVQAERTRLYDLAYPTDFEAAQQAEDDRQLERRIQS